MKIKEVRCDQFAGLRDREIDLKSGLNLIIGENESGKSTLVELIYRMFFQSSPSTQGEIRTSRRTISRKASENIRATLSTA